VSTEIRVRGAADVTDAELHVYADGTSGDDANDGRTVGTPKKTLAAVFAMLPEVLEHNTAVHLSGIFTDPGVVSFGRVILNGVYLVLDGGSSVTQSAGPFTATASDAARKYVTVSGAGWTPDVYAGYWLEVTSGSQIGTFRTIQENTADRITVCRLFAANPGLCDFRIVRPATTFLSSAGHCAITFTGFSGSGTVLLQNVFINGTNPGFITYLNTSYNSGRFWLNRLVFDSAGPYGFGLSQTDILVLNDSGYNPDTFAYVSNTGRGVGIRTGYAYLSDVGPVSISTSYFKELRLHRAGMGWALSAATMFGGSRSNHVQITGCRPAVIGNQIYNSSGFSPTKISGSPGVGLLVDNSYCGVGPAVIVESNASHGIESRDQSTLVLNGAVVGSGNAGAGVYAHTHSAVRTKSGSPPTLTGAVGDCSTDGSTEATSWADIDAGSPVSDLNEMTTIEAE